MMRLTTSQIDFIRQLTAQLAGDRAQVRVFGSRLDDAAKGGDLDLLLELPEPVENPAMLAAHMSAKVSRKMHGRKVDVVISAPNLKKLPIHEVGHREGRLL
ncbi:MAG: nucleotidyltransferase domain-containing protein [Gammaproteobacteria bacterium]|nr:nucleotidyltransferase domain-containing protein [Gammaproteobacteria bacterium]